MRVLRVRRKWNAFAFAAATLLVALSVAQAAFHSPNLISARIENHGPTLELHFQFDSNPPRLDLTAHGNELWIDLGRTGIEIPPRPLFGHEAPPIESVRALQIDPSGGKSRIVVEVHGKADYAIARLKREIVLRIANAGADPNIAAPILVHSDSSKRRVNLRTHAPSLGRAAEALAVSAPPTPEYRYDGAAIIRPRTPDMPSQTFVASGLKRPVVMIDPGHGGYDPGTQSSAGVAEKDLALQIAIRLKSALEARGIAADLTRNTDVFIPLPERTRLANRASADLFVSIHLNSSPNAQTTGIEVYYLNNTTDHATMRLARIENGTNAGYGGSDSSNLNYILTDLRQNYKASEAASLARMIDVQTVADLDAGLGINVNALGAKMGPFYVLVGAHMPAVLVECGFLSNPGEAVRLKSAQYQDLMAGGIAAAIVHYFNADLAVGNL